MASFYCRRNRTCLWFDLMTIHKGVLVTETLCRGEVTLFLFVFFTSG